MTPALPRGVERILARTLPSDLREPIAGDLAEAFAARVRLRGALRARAWVWWQALRIASSFGRERATHRRDLPPIADEVCFPGRGEIRRS